MCIHGGLDPLDHWSWNLVTYQRECELENQNSDLLRGKTCNTNIASKMVCLHILAFNVHFPFVHNKYSEGAKNAKNKPEINQ